MNALVIYESMFGSTAEIARAIADGLDGAPVQPGGLSRLLLDDPGF